MRYPVWQICLICGLLLLLSGCAPLVQNDQPSRTGWVPLAAGQTVGQTFTARFQGLQGINFHLSPDQPGDGVIQLTVHSRTANPEVLATSQLPLKQLTSPGWYRFNFPPIQNSNQQEYELTLDLAGSGSARVAKGPGESYLEGALSQNGTPVDAQAAFRLAYDRGQAFMGLAGEGLSWLLYLLAAALLFFLPGWALLALALPGWSERAWTEKLGLAGGLSLAIYPVLFLWTYILGLHLGKFYAWLPPLIGAAILIWLYIRKPDKRLFRVKNPGWDNLLPDLAFAAILLLLIFSRLWPIRGLTAPLWGDSLQHTMIAQLLVDHNGLFTSWAPYAELVTFTYHFGFHSFVAVFHWLSGLSLAGSTLWTGQIVNLIAILGLVPLANRLAPNRWTAALTILVAGLLTSIPQIYLNWGRYTQLAGQAILLCALYLSWELLERKEILWSVTVLAWVALAGVALSHYRVVVFAVLFLVAYFLIYFRKAGAWHLIKRIFIIGLGGALLYLPWFMRAFSGTLLRILSSFLRTPAGQISAGVQEDIASFTITSYIPAILWLLLILAVAWGFWRRSREAILIVLWSFLCLLAANPQWLRLPGTGAIRTFTVIIGAYIPVAILLGAAGGWLISSLTHSRLRKDQPAPHFAGDSRLPGGSQPLVCSLPLE